MNVAQGVEDESADKPSPTILVVDDVVLARMVAASQLRHHGFTVIEVSSADEAMRILGRFRIEPLGEGQQARTEGSPDLGRGALAWARR